MHIAGKLYSAIEKINENKDLKNESHKIATRFNG
jgi:hypothetical protein